MRGETWRRSPGEKVRLRVPDRFGAPAASARWKNLASHTVLPWELQIESRLELYPGCFSPASASCCGCSAANHRDKSTKPAYRFKVCREIPVSLESLRRDATLWFSRNLGSISTSRSND